MPDPIVTEVHKIGLDAVTVVLSLPAEHPAFDGHFPGHPILPGVVQVDWAVRLAETYLETASPSTRDLQVKFRRPMSPQATVSLDLRVNRVRNLLDFVYRHGEAIASNGRIRLDPPP